MRKLLRVLAWAALAGFALAGRAEPIVYTAILSGAAESPPVTSAGTGSVIVTIDPLTYLMRVQATFSGLVGSVTAAHIHCCTANPGEGTVGVATPTPTFPGFPAGASAGSYDMVFNLMDAASYNGSFVTASGGTAAGAMTAFLAGLDAGRAYFNIHTSFASGGEIRGFLVRQVAEPGSLALAGTALLALAVAGRMRRRIA